MANQNNKSSKPKTLLYWVHKNRLKIVLFSFFVVVPILFVVTLYTATYQSYKKVHFDSEVSLETEFFNKFVSKDDPEEFTLTFTWTELKNPKLNTVSNELEGGYYKFQMHYTPNLNYQVTNLRVTPVLQTMWTDMRSIGNPTSLLTSPKTVQVNFNYDLPVSPLWFVEVTDPVLYLKLDYVYQTAGTPLSKTIYVRIILDDLIPNKVIPNS